MLLPEMVNPSPLAPLPVQIDPGFDEALRLGVGKQTMLQADTNNLRGRWVFGAAANIET